MPEAWLLLFVGIAILIAVALDLAFFGGTQRGAHGPQAVNAHYPLPQVTGVLRLHDPIYGMRAVAQVGGPCKGLGRYGDLLGGTPVVVKDQAGTVVATGALDIGRVAAGSACEFNLVVGEIPKADAYEFDIGGRTAGRYRYDDLVARGWQVELTLG